MYKPKVIVICGPTASGKTALSIELAKKIDGEIISCDSMQIYKDMNIGTAKVTKSEMQGIKHYLVDFVSPDTRYSVADYKTDAEKAIENPVCATKMVSKLVRWQENKNIRKIKRALFRLLAAQRPVTKSRPRKETLRITVYRKTADLSRKISNKNGN